MEWEKKFDYKYKITHGAFTIRYNTASELGTASAEIKFRHYVNIVNPYEPDFIEFDEFDEARWARFDELKLN